jgi:ribonuclease PH
MMGSGSMIETQISAEGSTYSRDQLDELMDLAVKGIGELIVAQEKATA